MFKSPLQICPVCKQYVQLDQTQAECAAKHGCHTDECPLANEFAPPAPSAEPAPAPAPASKPR